MPIVFSFILRYFNGDSALCSLNLLSLFKCKLSLLIVVDSGDSGGISGTGETPQEE